MPNWTSNEIRAEGSPEQVSDFLEKIKGENGVIDFNSIIPMPEILRNTGSGATIIDGHTVNEWYIVEHADFVNTKPGVNRRFTPEEDAQLQEIGARSWYDWSFEHWGTKWNACHPETTEADPDYAVIEFQTAWDAPEPIYHKLAELFPGLTLYFGWRHEDEGVYPHTLTFPAKETVGAA